MKKLFLVSVLVLFTLSACIPSFLGGGAEEAPAAAPAVDVDGTVEAASSTQAVQTLDALATPTLEPPTPTDEPTATVTETLAPTEEETVSPTETQTGTPEADAETTGTPDGSVTPEAGTGAPDDATATLDVTATPSATETPAPTATSVYPSATSPIGINLPPENLVPRYRIEVKNTTKGPVYISLQGSTAYDYKPVIEYDIPHLSTVRYFVPEGYYKVVVYVGKEPMIDYVRINKPNEVQIVIRKNELKIEK